MLPEVPKSLLIVGAGAIGVEFAYMYRVFGAKVTLVEMLDHILPVEDDEVALELEKIFRKSGDRGVSADAGGAARAHRRAA